MTLLKKDGNSFEMISFEMIKVSSTIIHWFPQSVPPPTCPKGLSKFIRASAEEFQKESSKCRQMQKGKSIQFST